MLDPRRRPGIEHPIWSTVHGKAVLSGQGPLRDLPDADRRQPEARTLTTIGETVRHQEHGQFVHCGLLAPRNSVTPR